jgi:small subunit ribosomal protein S4
MGCAPGRPSRSRPAVRALAEAATGLTTAMPGWLQVDFDRLEGTVVRVPERGEITAPVDEQLIVEFYSRR